ncbi:MAG: protein-L-isoaspartate O-methyltransferase [Hyphomicrobiales bacterium]|nr:protein-L-isoaspartate O-methyltransferase [Hyphomicrobiales bacterium]
MTSFETLRQRMVDSQIRANDVTDHRVIKAFADTPRELFVPSDQKPFAYGDRDIPISSGETGERFLISPMVIAKTVQALQIDTASVVLDIGCGSGYSTAILAQLAGSVVAVEQDETFVAAAEANLQTLGFDNAAILQGNLVDGLAGEGPFDAILLSGGVEEVSDTLKEQLNDRGRLVAVVMSGRTGQARLYERIGSQVSERTLFDASAPILPGFRKTREFVF